MSQGTKSDRALLREAFALLLGLRAHPEARELLRQAVAFLRLLGHRGEAEGPPVVVSIQLTRLGKY